MRRAAVIGFASWMTVSAAACVLGEPEDPGCVEDAECDEGYSCRAGACLEEVPGGPFVPADGGAGADAGADAGR